MDAARLFARISVAGADSSARELRQFGSQVDSTQNHLNQIGRGSVSVASGLARIGVAAGALALPGMGAAARTAISFQDAFAGVRKTVEGSPAELDGLYGSLRKLATRIPVKFEDLAGIAQEAG